MNASILVVDDDPDSRQLLRAFVEGEGLLAILAASGREALTMLEKLRPDLVLMDAMMPGLDGFDTCRMIKASANGSGLPVIFMTGLTQTEDVVRGLNAGGVDYVTKPLNLRELLARIHVHLSNARLAQAAITALDTAGGRLVSADASGGIFWATTKARALLAELGTGGRRVVEDTLRRLIDTGRTRAPELVELGSVQLSVSYHGTEDGAAHVFAISLVVEGNEVESLQSVFGLTRREAEVLLWVSRGKSNRDTSEILNVSARTVNKHLEQVFIKMGVENRAAAAAAATRIVVAQVM
jgi:DNA-binding response OmpR family regulator